jgi:hypothetical protein
MTFLYYNFYDIFNIYWRDTNYRENLANLTLQEFTPKSWGIILEPWGLLSKTPYE